MTLPLMHNEQQTSPKWRLGLVVLLLAGGIYATGPLRNHPNRHVVDRPEQKVEKRSEDNRPTLGEEAKPNQDSVPQIRDPVQTYLGNDRYTNELFGLTGDTTYPSRVAALENIFTRKSPDDIEMLYSFLSGRITPQETTPEELVGLQKLVYDFLFVEDPDAERLQDHLLRVLTDTDTAATTTLAALSHIESFYDRPGDHSKLTNQLWATMETNNSRRLSALAFAALGRIAVTHENAIDRSRLSALVDSRLSTLATSAEELVDALQLGTWLHSPATLPVARKIAVNTLYDVTVRITAFGVISAAGNLNDIAWLRNTEQHSSYPIKAVARATRNTLLKHNRNVLK